jgi:hypothetical protein
MGHTRMNETKDENTIYCASMVDLDPSGMVYISLKATTVSLYKSHIVIGLKTSKVTIMH